MEAQEDGFSVADMTMEGDFDDAEAPEFKWRAEIRRQGRGLRGHRSAGR